PDPALRYHAHQFERAAAKQAGILVGLEVAHPDYDRLWMADCRNPGEAPAEAVHEELLHVRVPGSQSLDLRLLGTGVHLVEMDKRHGMNLDLVGDHELHACKPNAVSRQPPPPPGGGGIGEVQHHLGSGVRQLVESDILYLELYGAFIDEAAIAFGAAHGDL